LQCTFLKETADRKTENEDEKKEYSAGDDQPIFFAVECRFVCEIGQYASVNLRLHSLLMNHLRHRSIERRLTLNDFFDVWNPGRLTTAIGHQ
jgi:hypothetical protein